MAWTTFSSLTVGTTQELDANLAILTALAPVSCTIAGSANALALTPVNAGSPLISFLTGMQFTGIASASNSGNATATVTGIAGVLPIYKDTSAGPVLLTGGEIIQNCAITLRYDLALNAGGGGFHLVSQQLSLPSNDPITRFNSTIVAFSYAAIGPQAATLFTVSMAGAQTADNVIVGALNPGGAVPAIIVGYVSATGSVVVSVYNAQTAATLVAATLNFRVTDIGFQ